MTTVMNRYKPDTVAVSSVKDETQDVFTVDLELKSVSRPGQFYELSVSGIGEAPISVASSTSENLKFTIRRIGSVTNAIWKQREIGIRGPYGNSWPYMDYDDIIAVAGGIGIPPIRSLIWELNGKKNLWVLYGARTPSDLVYKYEHVQWEKLGNIILTVDRGDQQWTGNVGLVTQYIERVPLNREFGAFIIGPPIMMMNTVKRVLELGIKEENIFLSLERRMECGFGVCGHCNIGQFYVCEDGPIFRYSDVKTLPELFL